MQTFLPFRSFRKSAKCLDRQRLGKQRVECKQLLSALGISIGGSSQSRGWTNHPAARMWRGHERSLCRYAIEVCREWRRRGYQDSLLQQFQAALPLLSGNDPDWLGDEQFHRSHRSNLLRKMPEHYRQYWPDERDDLPYIWPV